MIRKSTCSNTVRRREATAAILGVAAAMRVAAEQQPQKQKKPLRVLLVVAHPDDEYYFAATVYRLARELDAVVDQMIITNGEAGYRYATLAEKVYGVPLTDETTGRSRLPEIRKQEALAAGRILGIRRHYFLDERDHRFTLDGREAMDQVWDCAGIRQRLRNLIAREQYDFVFTMLPRESTHGHHQAATLLALQVVNELEPRQRPVVLGAEPRTLAGAVPPAYAGLPIDKDLASSTQPAPEFAFRRQATFGFRNALSYDIVVNWVVAEHKSQGLFQRDVARHDAELFWRFRIGPPDAEERTAALIDQLQPSEVQPR